MHVMVSCYLPAEGQYTVPAGLFGSRSGFTGPLRVVDKFTTLATGRGTAPVFRDAGKQAAQMQQQFDRRAATEARAAGATPIRVRLPINGKLFRLEKILILPNDKLYLDLRYSGWKAAK